MNSFDHIHNGKTFRFTLNKSESFQKFRVELFTNNYCHYKSREIIISKHVIEEMMELFKTGDPFLNVSRFEFRDRDRSFMIFLKGETIIIGQTYNLVSGKREEFVVEDIDKKKFLNYLEEATV